MSKLRAEQDWVKGVFEQGGHESPAPFGALRAWVIGKLLWDPSLDDRALIEEFLDGYYGAAAPHLMRWLLVQQQAVRRRRDIFLGAYDLTTSAWLTLEDLNEGTRLFDRALEAVADEETLTFRVRRAKLSICLLYTSDAADE